MDLPDQVRERPSVGTGPGARVLAAVPVRAGSRHAAPRERPSDDRLRGSGMPVGVLRAATRPRASAPDRLADGTKSSALSATALRATVGSARWSSSPPRARAGMVSVLTPAEILIAAGRLAGARPPGCHGQHGPLAGSSRRGRRGRGAGRTARPGVPLRPGRLRGARASWRNWTCRDPDSFISLGWAARG